MCSLHEWVHVDVAIGVDPLSTCWPNALRRNDLMVTPGQAGSRCVMFGRHVRINPNSCQDA